MIQGYFNCPSSGTAGSKITYGAKSGETPVFIGSKELTSATYKWTASGSGTNEYYCELAGGGDPSITDISFGRMLLMDSAILLLALLDLCQITNGRMATTTLLDTAPSMSATIAAIQTHPVSRSLPRRRGVSCATKKNTSLSTV